MICGERFIRRIGLLQKPFKRYIDLAFTQRVLKHTRIRHRPKTLTPRYWQIDPKTMESEDWLNINGHFKVCPWAVSGLESSILVSGPDFRVVFDMGYAYPAAVRCQHVFISHGHTDHVGAIISHASKRGLYGMPPATYYLPPHLEKPLTDAIRAFSTMNGEQIDLKLRSVKIDERIQLPGGIFVKPFPTIHRVPSQGYILYRVKKKLKPNFQDRPAQEIASLVKSNQDIFIVDVIPEVAYTGDTLSDVFRNPHNPDILKVKLLITEATYVDDEIKGGSTAVDRARQRGHMHLDEIIQNESLFSEVENLLLVHFSDKYSTKYVSDTVSTKLPESMKNKVHIGLVLKKKFEYE